MNTITDKLAAALRDMIDTAQGGPRANRAANIEASREAIVVLAEYDAYRAITTARETMPAPYTVVIGEF